MRATTWLIALGAFLLAAAPAAAQESAWVQRALDLQYELGSDVGFRDAPWVGTHNSFNSTAEMGETLSAQDSNQQITIVEQLDQGMRSIELDLHYFPSLSGGGFDIVVCHARDRTEFHAGCTAEKNLEEVLDEIVAWLRDHPDQVLMLYLEDDMDEAAGYEMAGAIVDEKLGSLIFRPQPPADGCQELPLDTSRDDVRAAGKHVFIVTDCGGAASWRGAVFTWEEHAESQPTAFTDFPDCGSEFTPEEYETTLVRYYEDSTQLSANTGNAADRITLDSAAQMARCGVDLLHFDQLALADPRLHGVIWSWAVGEPGAGNCSTQRVGDNVPFGRWKSRKCKGKRRAACRLADGRWKVSADRIGFKRADEDCEERDGAFAVPRTGYEAQLLRLAMLRAGVRGVWLGQQRDSAGDWSPLDPR